jgi:hypothetical protein
MPHDFRREQRSFKLFGSRIQKPAWSPRKGTYTNAPGRAMCNLKTMALEQGGGETSEPLLGHPQTISMALNGRLSDGGANERGEVGG